jgi:uncharacterized protein YdeI (YjbR/CyaY-like superfamily)
MNRDFFLARQAPSPQRRVHPEQWRDWLAAHHDSGSEVWLVFHKRQKGTPPSIAYEDAVNEALCFGWIDSLVQRLDTQRYARKFTPANPAAGGRLPIAGASPNSRPRDA